jgi:hypothetical protein
MRSKSTWIVGTEHEQTVAAGHRLRRHGDARATQRAASERVIVADQPLRLEGGDDRRVEMLREGNDLFAARTRAVAADDHRAVCRYEARDGALELVVGRRDGGAGYSALARLGRWIVAAGQLLHLVREHEVGHVALHDGVLHRQRGQFGRVPG